MCNTLNGLSETAGELYLKLLDVMQGHTREGERKAFMSACRYDQKCGEVLDYILRNAPNAPDERTRIELSRFFAERWRNNFMENTNAQSK
jgi:dsDNA-binding SOS-regulon protein